MRRSEQSKKRPKWQSGTRRTRSRLILCSAYLTPDQMRKLSVLVARTKVPATEFFRAGIEVMLANPELVGTRS